MRIHPLQTTVAVLALGLAFAGPAAASTITCSDAGALGFTDDGTAKVHNGTDARLTAASQCQIATPITGANPPRTADLDDVNAVGFFGIINWEINTAKVDLETPAGGGQSGDWTITNADFESFTYMITFKDGGNTNLVSFLFNGLYDEGGWNTPFTDPPFTAAGDGSRDVSHFTVFQAAGGTPPPPPPEGIPEPAPIALFGAGLLALAWVRRRWLMN